MYKLMIVEDEQIERESLQVLIQNCDFPIDEIMTAKNGQEGLEKYHLYHPDIILADIDMPVLGGLDMVEIIRKNDHKTMCLILTSYDYFSYAKRAIQLDVEDFLLKPAESTVLQKSLSQVIEKLMKNNNMYNQTSTLIKKMKEMKPLAESECFYAIMMKQNEVKLLETFRLANIVAISCCCVLFDVKNNLDNQVNILRNELEDIGYYVIQGTINNYHILFILGNRVMTEVDKEAILDVLKHDNYKEVKWSLGNIQNEIGLFYQSFEDAKYNLNNENQTYSVTSDKIQEEQNDKLFALDWSQRIMNSLYSDEQKTIHELCQEFIHYDNLKINKLMKLIISQLIMESNRKYQLGIEEADVSLEQLEYKNFQNLEFSVSQLLSKIIKPLKNMKYYNNSSLIKKSMNFIEKNYMKPISLNTLADELNVSPFYISKLFSKELGRNFTDVINNIRINQAKRLIRNDCPFKEVASLVGFGSQSYFTKTFRKIVGMSPTDYRKLFP